MSRDTLKPQQATLLVLPDGTLFADEEAGGLLGMKAVDRRALEEHFDTSSSQGAERPWSREDSFDEKQVWVDRATGAERRLRVSSRRVGPGYRLLTLFSDTGDASSLQAEAMLRALNESLAAGAPERSMREILQLIVELARELTGARYAALGVLREDGTGLSDFIYAGVSQGQAAAIGHLPEGKGLLGAIIHERRTIRVANIAADSRSSGFPLNHPPMTSFLGTPLVLDRKVFGNFYLTDKRGALEFSEEDARRLERFSEQAARTARLAQGLTASQHRVFRSMVETAPYGVVFFSPVEETSSYCNEAARLILGLTGRSKPAPELYELTSPAGFAIRPEERPEARAARGESTINREVRVLRTGRDPLPALISAAPLL
ncbi:MAG TPA: GAF domain-containing protein, partial [Anaeromyxobacteraceae bacterium]|nr:GAF domain-containing protein [Anaeromyxobacteraceae bacterium]